MIRRLAIADRGMLLDFFEQHWGGPMMVTRGQITHADQVEGFVWEQAGEWLGLITFVMRADDHGDGGCASCEVTSLDSMAERRGIGSALLDAVIAEARLRSAARLWLITTNDNLHALRFYQRRGWRLVALYPEAVSAARQIKPGIPLIGFDQIPIRDELELAFDL
ncbi:MAG: GNAT family N-acetyltransferase [Roseiflexaceae bacterium]